MLGATGNHTFNPRTFTVAQMLEAAEPKLEKSWKDDPLTKATLQLSLGNSYLAIDRRDRAQSHLDNALATFHALGDQKGSAATLRALALLAVNDGRPEAGVQLYEQALQKLKYLGKDAPPLLVYHASMELANVLTLYLNQRRPECRTLFDEAIALATRDTSIPRTDLASAIFYRAGISMADGNYDEAEALYKNSLTIGRQEDPGGYWEMDPLFGLTNASARKGDFAAAKEFARQRYEVAVRFEGPDHVDAAVSKMIWARHRAEMGEIRESVNQLREAMPVIRKAYRPPSLDLWVCLAAAARILNRAERFGEAEPYAREALAVVDSARLTQSDSRRAESLFHLGEALRGQGRDREAIDALQKSAAVYERAGSQWAKAAERIRAMLSRGQNP
jgi:tetratricopeptide (TPR) repeat protein